METFNIEYSTKNIPLPGKDEYKLQLIQKTEKLIKRMRWKSLQFLGKLESQSTQTYGFPSRKCPPAIEQLSKFELDLMMMIKNIEFRKVVNEFQDKLDNDLQEIRQSSNLFIHADKSRNIYKVKTNEYDKLMKENITKTYRKSDSEKVQKINIETKNVVKNLKIIDRLDKMQETQSYLTIKDHKDNFPNRVQCRLINPSKTDIGKISKHILDKINLKVVEKYNLKQWKNTSSVIEWFKSINNKEECSFIIFDIESFYPSISQKLFTDAINFAKSAYNISNEEIDIIMQARKTPTFL